MTNETGNPPPQVIIYENEDKVIRVNVRLEDESAWLTNLQLAELFEVSKSTVSEHIKNIFASEELSSDAVVRKFRTTYVFDRYRGATGRVGIKDHLGAGKRSTFAIRASSYVLRTSADVTAYMLEVSG